MSKEKLTVEQNPEAVVERKVLAQAIVDISEATKKMSRGGLNRKAIVILVSARAGLGRGTIENVMNALEALRKDYTTL